jgi:folate-binding protein YgfZ
MSPSDSSSAAAPVSAGYAGLTSGVAVWADPDRALLRVDGARAEGVLNGLLSADVGAVQPGEAVLSFVLTARGRPVAVPTVIRLEKAFLLDISRAALPGLLDHFGTYLPPRFASVTVLESGSRISLLGPRAPAVAAGLQLVGSPVRIVRPPEEGGGFDYYLLEDSDFDAIRDAAREAGGAVASPFDYETWRIELGIPRFGVDVTAENLPQETGLVSRAASFEKGCYTGQEVVARIHYRGQVNRHLRGLRSLEPSSVPLLAAGMQLVREDRPAGVITSWCTSPRFGSIGLAYVRREIDPGDQVEADSDRPIACIVTELPFTLR